MKVFIIDTEYLSWGKKDSLIHPQKRSQNKKPEIIQIYVEEIFTKKKNFFSAFVKPRYYKSYPYRISRLTRISKKYLDVYGQNFIDVYRNFCEFVPEKSLILSNGNDFQILDSNIELYNYKKIKKKFFYVDLNFLIKNHKLFKKNDNKFITSAEIKKKLMIKNLKGHNAKDDVKIFKKCLKLIGFKKSNLKYFQKKIKTLIL